jgi:hypothetical protein
LLFYKAISISSEKTRVSDATYTSGVTVSVTIAVTVAVAEEAVSRASSRVGDWANGVGDALEGVEETSLSITLLQDVLERRESDLVATTGDVAFTSRVVVSIVISGLVIVPVLVLIQH